MTQPCVERTEHVGESNFIEEVEEEIRRCRATVDHEQVLRLRCGEDAINLAAMFEIDEVCLRVKALRVEFS